MKGAVVSNAFLSDTTFREPAEMLSRAAAERGIRLDACTNVDLAFPIGDVDSVRGYLGDLDFIVFWDKDVRCCENLEMCGYRTFNSSYCIRVCDDKSLTHSVLARAGVPSLRTVPVPMTFPSVGYTDLSFLDRAADLLGFPMVVKDCFGSYGQQVRLVRDMRSLMAEFDGASQPMILQEYIECGSSDLRLEVVGGEAVEAVSRQGPPGDFRANCNVGGTMSPHEPTEDEVELALSAASAVGADFCGVDILVTEDGPRVCEVNSNAHIMNLYRCTGHDVAGDIMDHITAVVR